MLFAFLFDFFYPVAWAYLMVLLHELAHIAVAYVCGVKAERFEVLPFGITAHLSGAYIKKPIHEITIAAAGPIFSGLLAFACYKYNFGSYLTIANSAIAIINCVPALPLDGGRIIRAILTEQWGHVKAYNFMLKVTKVVAFMLAASGITLLWYTKFNFSLLLIGAFLIVNIIAEQRGSRYILINEIIKSRQKIYNGCAERAGIIAIHADEPARKALKLLSYNKYHLISVIDSNMNIIGTVTETQLIDRLAQKGIRTKAANILD
jgi:stage IV sporulation protein FB